MVVYHVVYSVTAMTWLNNYNHFGQHKLLFFIVFTHYRIRTRMRLSCGSLYMICPKRGIVAHGRRLNKKLCLFTLCLDLSVLLVSLNLSVRTTYCQESFTRVKAVGYFCIAMTATHTMSRHP